MNLGPQFVAWHNKWTFLWEHVMRYYRGNFCNHFLNNCTRTSCNRVTFNKMSSLYTRNNGYIDGN
ncbi:hypothetical protein BDFB_013927, partial [Asbolus verrucosus]